jgi:methylglutaconyl-CoA hydratase
MIKEINNGHVKTDFSKGITTIEFYHPQSNALPLKLLEELAHTIHAAANDNDTRVIVLRSEGDRTFCSGAFFDELKNLKNLDESKRFFMGFANLLNTMRKCPKFIIGRIQGRCVGGGVGIASAVDYAIATDAAEIKLSELSIGIGPFVIGPAVERKIGAAAFSNLAIDATKWRNADWAKRKGLYAEVHTSIENMDESIKRLADSLSHFSPDAMREMKNIFWKGCENWDELLYYRAGISAKLILGAEAQQALERFREKVPS